tara:strand:+ start:774 stop:1775 length:1002 start_codon:yes stop_codon:yes gene_type:complete
MKTLGINMTHDASVCQCDDGDITTFLEEERLTGIKHDELPVKSFHKVVDTDSVISFTGLEYADDLVGDKVNNFVKYVLAKSEYGERNVDTYLEHHLLHAYCGFYNSGFSNACVVVVDGMGNYVDDDHHEVASIFHMTYPTRAKLVGQQVCIRYDSEKLKERDVHDTWPIGIGMAYSSISSYLGFGSMGSGKVMGLSAYGVDDSNIKPFVLEDGTVNSTLFYRTYDGACFIPYDYLPDKWDLRVQDDKFQRIANLTYRLQKDFELQMIDTILTGLKMTQSKNLIVTGGCALNCVANYEYLKHLPESVKMYVEPVSTDAGTSIGLAKYLYHTKNK